MFPQCKYHLPYLSHHLKQVKFPPKNTVRPLPTCKTKQTRKKGSDQSLPPAHKHSLDFPLLAFAQDFSFPVAVSTRSVVHAILFC